MFNPNTHNNNHDTTTESFLGRNGRRIAAVAFIALAGSAGVSTLASANEAPSHDGKAPAESELLDSDYAEPRWNAPDHAKYPKQPGYKDPVDPEYGGPYEMEEVPGDKIPEVPGDDPKDPEKDPKNPEDDPQKVPGDEVTTTTTTEPEYPEDEYPEHPEEEYPEYPEEEYPEPEVEEKTEERTGGEELAYTGSDSKLPLVGAGLVLAGGLAAGGSVLSRRLKGARG